MHQADTRAMSANNFVGAFFKVLTKYNNLYIKALVQLILTLWIAEKYAF